MPRLLLGRADRCVYDDGTSPLRLVIPEWSDPGRSIRLRYGGTEGSNPSPSSGESCEPRSLDPSRARSLTTAAAWRADAERQFRLRDAFGEGRAEFAAAPREYAVLVRHFNKPRAAAYLRITVRTGDDTKRLIAAAAKILEQG